MSLGVIVHRLVWLAVIGVVMAVPCAVLATIAGHGLYATQAVYGVNSAYR